MGNKEHDSDDEFPVTITLRFKSTRHRNNYLGGHIDGWGEGAPYALGWNWTKKKMAAVLFDTFYVHGPFDENGEDAEIPPWVQG